jgi:hypothetical protein
MLRLFLGSPRCGDSETMVGCAVVPAVPVLASSLLDKVSGEVTN